jgi:hypothetical protein
MGYPSIFVRIMDRNLQPGYCENGSRLSAIICFWSNLAIPWENGCNESFNGKFKAELLNREVFYALKEAQVIIECWRQEYTIPSDRIAAYIIVHLRRRPDWA